MNEIICGNTQDRVKWRSKIAALNSSAELGVIARKTVCKADPAVIQDC